MGSNGSTQVSEHYAKYPWLCPTTAKYTSPCNPGYQNSVSKSESDLTTEVTVEGLDLFGVKCVYYPISHNKQYDVLYGEDQLEYVTRAFNFIGYFTQMPPNVQVYQLQGIWGDDVVTMYVSNPAFRYWSTYGNEDRNTPEVYPVMKPRIGDLIYIPANDTFYEIYSENKYVEAFGLESHTYVIVMRVFKDTKYTISANSPTIPYMSDPIYRVTTSALAAQDQFHDPLQLNDEFDDINTTANKNAFLFDYLYRK